MRLITILWVCWLVGTAPAYAQAYGSIAGQIWGTDNKPLAYATILLEGAATGTTADAQGNFLLKEVPAGRHRLKVRALGFKEVRQEVAVTAGVESTVQLQLAEQATELVPVVVSATRTEQSIESIPIPVDVIPKERIQQIGAVRLNEVLSEQTGLQLISNHGTGLQIQGLGSDYVLILIDGEPVIGRTSGVLDLTRLAVGNIERVEVIKGPSSSLYGSEAMAGVVNIITKKEDAPLAATLRTRYSSFNTLNTSGEVNWQSGKRGVYLFADRLRSDGYDLSPETIGNTAPPFTAYTFNPKLSYDFSNRFSAKLSLRWYTEDQENLFPIVENREERVLQEEARRTDWSLMPALSYTFGAGHKALLKNYTTRYKTDSDIRYRADRGVYDQSYFNQLFNRSEVQVDLAAGIKHTTTLGAGYTLEEVEATRYDNLNRFTASYAFAQHQWRPGEEFNVVAGARFDQHSEYASRLSPKLAAQYNPLPWLALQASVGGGYKAPDFRQLLLNFTNAVSGYSVFGASLVGREIGRLKEQGQLDAIYIDPATMQDIKAENSMAYNAGFNLKPWQSFSLRANFFRNNIQDLIETAPVARKKNGQNVFSYFNVSRVVTQGMESQLDYKPLPQLSFSLGYQLLDAKDADVLERVEDGKVYKRDAVTQEVRRVSTSEYGGLFNRSRHSGNVKAFYNNERYGYSLSLRGMYRGRFGFGDSNGNQILDAKEEYAPGYFTWNISATKQLLKHFLLEGGVTNLFNTTSTYEPSLAGRIIYSGITFKVGANR